jgi:hypothetical protein
MCIVCCRFYIARDTSIVKIRRTVVPTDSSALFAISVAAELAELPIQNLRVYERRGLLAPARTPGGTRLYSQADIVLLRRIAALLTQGLNLAGIRRVLELEREVDRLRARLGG